MWLRLWKPTQSHNLSNWDINVLVCSTEFSGKSSYVLWRIVCVTVPCLVISRLIWSRMERNTAANPMLVSRFCSLMGVVMLDSNLHLRTIILEVNFWTRNWILSIQCLANSALYLSNGMRNPQTLQELLYLPRMGNLLLWFLHDWVNIPRHGHMCIVYYL